MPMPRPAPLPLGGFLVPDCLDTGGNLFSPETAAESVVIVRNGFQFPVLSLDTLVGLVQRSVPLLDQAYERIKGENKELKTVADDYEALCRGYGKEKIAASVQAIREQETAERMRRRMARQHRNEIGAR